MNEMINVSVVIPTYNRLSLITQVLDALTQQTYPLDKFEVIVVSDGSTDGTNEFLRAQATPLRLRPFFQQNQGPAAARNRGVTHANGEIVLFIDDDVVPCPQMIAEHISMHHAEGGAVAVLGPMLAPKDVTMYPWVRWEHAVLARQYQDMTNGKWSPTARQFYTGNTSLARRHLLASGGFDPRFRRAEDIELAYRLARDGLRFEFNPKAIGWHYVERSFDSWAKTPYEYGRNDVIFSHDPENSWLLLVIGKEMQERHRFIRLLNRLCIDHPLQSRLAIGFLRLIVKAGDGVEMSALQLVACSGIFNLQYYQGVADQLGGRKTFYSELT